MVGNLSDMPDVFFVIPRWSVLNCYRNFSVTHKLLMLR